MTDQNNTDRDALMRRVQKLLAVAQDSRANPNEAANAAAMAEKIMRKYQIDNADLVQKQLKDADNFATREVFAKMKLHQPSKRIPPWAQWLAVSVAKLHDCGVRNAWSRHESGEPSACMRIYGFGMDVELAAWTFEYLRDELIRAVRQFNKEQACPDKLASNSFRTGFVTAVLRNLQKLIAQKERENAADATGTALVVAKAQAVAERFGEFEYDSRDSKARVDADAFHDGVRKGRNVDVSRRAVGTNQQAAPLAIGR